MLSAKIYVSCVHQFGCCLRIVRPCEIAERLALIPVFRTRLLTPILECLTRCNVTANLVTLLSLLFGLAFCPLFFRSAPAALICLLLHVLIDGLDGPLARHRGTASAGGSLSDTLADQTVVAASTATLIIAGLINGFAGALYIFTYTLVVVFAMIRNALTVPYAVVLRPRFIVYAWLLVELYWLPGTLTTVVWILLVPLVWQTYRGFITVRNKL